MSLRSYFGTGNNGQKVITSLNNEGDGEFAVEGNPNKIKITSGIGSYKGITYLYKITANPSQLNITRSDGHSNTIKMSPTI